MGTVLLSSEVNRAGREADYSPTLSAEVNAGSYVCILPTPLSLHITLILLLKCLKNLRVAIGPFEVINKAPNCIANHFAFVKVYRLQYLDHVCLEKEILFYLNLITVCLG